MSQNWSQRRRAEKPAARLQNILIVDDDPVIRDMMVDILESEGYAPSLARNGQEALQILHTQDNYLVFLDLMMPGYSGRDVCMALVSQPELRQRHVLVLMSAMDKIGETHDLDVDMVMAKPFVVDDVSAVLELYMR